MPVALYMDVHVPQPITDQLRRRGVDVLTAIEDGWAEREDVELLKRALELGRVIFTQDIRFKALAQDWQHESRPFAGLLFGHQLGGTLGQFVQDVLPELPGEECANCGNVAGSERPTVCPNCQFRDVSPCPICNEEVSRQSYTCVSGDLFCCLRCKNQVRLRFNSPMFLVDGSYNQPLVVVEEATAVHEV